MMSHLFTLTVITDDFGRTSQFYMARTDIFRSITIVSLSFSLS